MSYLLTCGADIEILTAKDELASQLTSKPEIKRLLGGDGTFQKPDDTCERALRVCFDKSGVFSPQLK